MGSIEKGQNPKNVGNHWRSPNSTWSFNFSKASLFSYDAIIHEVFNYLKYNFSGTWEQATPHIRIKVKLFFLNSCQTHFHQNFILEKGIVFSPPLKK